MDLFDFARWPERHAGGQTERYMDEVTKPILAVYVCIYYVRALAQGESTFIYMKKEASPHYFENALVRYVEETR